MTARGMIKKTLRRVAATGRSATKWGWWTKRAISGPSAFGDVEQRSRPGPSGAPPHPTCEGGRYQPDGGTWGDHLRGAGSFPINPLNWEGPWHPQWGVLGTNPHTPACGGRQPIMTAWWVAGGSEGRGDWRRALGDVNKSADIKWLGSQEAKEMTRRVHISWQHFRSKCCLVMCGMTSDRRTGTKWIACPSYFRRVGSKFWDGRMWRRRIESGRLGETSGRWINLLAIELRRNGLLYYYYYYIYGHSCQECEIHLRPERWRA